MLLSDSIRARSLGELDLAELVLDVLAAPGRDHVRPVVLVVHHFNHDRVVLRPKPFDHPSRHRDTEIIFIIMPSKLKVNFDKIDVICHIIMPIFLFDLDRCLIFFVVDFDFCEVVKSVQIFVDS